MSFGDAFEEGTDIFGVGDDLDDAPQNSLVAVKIKEIVDLVVFEWVVVAVGCGAVLAWHPLGHLSIGRDGQLHDKVGIKDGAPAGHGLVASAVIHELFHDGEAHLLLFAQLFFGDLPAQLRAIPFGDHGEESSFEFLDVGLLSQTGVARVFTVAVAVLLGTLVDGEIPSLAPFAGCGGAQGILGGGGRARLDPVGRGEGGDVGAGGVGNFGVIVVKGHVIPVVLVAAGGVLRDREVCARDRLHGSAGEGLGRGHRRRDRDVCAQDPLGGGGGRDVSRDDPGRDGAEGRRGLGTLVRLPVVGVETCDGGRRLLLLLRRQNLRRMDRGGDPWGDRGRRSPNRSGYYRRGSYRSGSRRSESHRSGSYGLQVEPQHFGRSLLRLALLLRVGHECVGSGRGGICEGVHPLQVHRRDSAGSR
mmetsp:Transcript_29251/g.67164  ORF Transcript_29251/g.67164 Transcript_29251/m.67164 type:complete len:416 (-) Transcript_29251:792-2039(-)